MATLVVGSEKNLKELGSRLFGEKVSAAVTKRAGAAIAEANPHVAIDALTPGTVLEIPDLPDVAVGPPLVGDPRDAGVAQDDDGLRASLEGLRAEAATAERAARAQRKAARVALDAPEIAELAKADPEFGNQVEDARAALKAADASAKERAAALVEAVTDWTAELDALAGEGR